MHTLRAFYIIGYREILRYWRDKPRIISSFARPLLFLFVFGSGLSPAMGGLARGLGSEGLEAALGEAIDYTKFIFPGVIGMNMLIASLMSGISIVWDREFGFLKEVLVAPISRAAVALGKTLGGSTIGVIQGLLILALAPSIGVSVTPMMVIQLIPLMLLASFATTSLGVLIAARMRTVESFGMIMNLLTMPMIFISGAMFPLRDLPSWMDFLVKINPVTYAIDPLRQVIFRAQGLPEAALEKLPQMGLGVIVFGHTMTIADDIIVIVAFGVTMIALAMWMFSIQD